jgi:hypothetical protein
VDAKVVEHSQSMKQYKNGEEPFTSEERKAREESKTDIDKIKETLLETVEKKLRSFDIE